MQEVDDTAVTDALNRSSLFAMPVQVTNPFTHQEMFNIVIEDPSRELQLITDANEWKFAREVLPLACGEPFEGPAAAIDDMLATPTGELLMMAQESVAVPLLFRSFAGGDVGATTATRNTRRPLQPRTIIVTVTSAAHAHTVNIVRYVCLLLELLY